jgi:hypothetical protein
VLVLALYSTAKSRECLSVECFQQYMLDCKKVSYINEETEASWGYDIVGDRNGVCEIEVTLLSAKEGGLELRQYEGNSMTCSYLLGEFAYPEKDLNSCTGELKEDLQSVIIDKLYKYVVDNLGEIGEELRNI